MKAALQLAGIALENDWTVRITPGRDSRNNAFLILDAARGAGPRVSATWHTRETGTYRLFSATLGSKRTSLTAVRKHLAS